MTVSMMMMMMMVMINALASDDGCGGEVAMMNG